MISVRHSPSFVVGTVETGVRILQVHAKINKLGAKSDRKKKWLQPTTFFPINHPLVRHRLVFVEPKFATTWREEPLACVTPPPHLDFFLIARR